MDNLRLATADEIAAIKDRSDLGISHTVIAFDRKSGPADIAVVKQVTELDPVFFAEETDDRRKMLFIWAIENTLRLMGTVNYHFQIAVADAAWQKVVETWGAERVSPVEQYRYVKALQPVPQPKES